VNVLGVWDGHDSGAVLLQDGRVTYDGPAARLPGAADHGGEHPHSSAPVVPASLPGEGPWR